MEIEVLELKDSLVEYLSKVNDNIPNIVENFRVGKDQEAYQQMTLLMEGLAWISDAVHLTREFHQVAVLEIKKMIEELHEALENSDTVLIADLLEYEINPKITSWKHELSLGKKYAQ